jgi:hypothetical protein
MNTRLLRRAAVWLAIPLAAGCARAVEVNSEPGTVYAIEVYNPRSVDMVVSYDDGRGSRTLGTVRAGTRERFVIAAPPQPSIQLSARSSSGSTSGPITVSLSMGQTTQVRLP